MVIRTSQELLPIKLKQIYVGICEVILEFKSDEISIEQVFISKNMDLALKLSQGRRSVIVAVVNYDLPVYEYAARFIKQAIVGTGSEDKIHI